MRKTREGAQAWDKPESHTFCHKAIQSVKQHPTKQQQQIYQQHRPSNKEPLWPSSPSNHVLPKWLNVIQHFSCCSVLFPFPGGYSIKSSCLYICIFVTGKSVYTDLSWFSLASLQIKYIIYWSLSIFSSTTSPLPFFFPFLFASFSVTIIFPC